MRRYIFLLQFVLGLCLLAASFWPSHPLRASSSTPLAYTLKVEGMIGPATYDLIKGHLHRAEQAGAAVVVLEMHTPGGLYESTQQIIQAITESSVPVVTYVSPSGAHAASAGTYILYASHIAAMAPGTNIGAATPIQMNPSGQGDKKPQDAAMPRKVEPSSTLEHKMVNDAVAYIKSLAELRGRNVEWAERAVREAETLTASEAINRKVIEVIAEDVQDLLAKIDGKVVKMKGGKTQALRTKGATIEKTEPGVRTKLLEIITNPNVAFLLMTLGAYGLIYEFAHPGVFFPGVAGIICLLLGLYALNVLPVNYAGLALLFLGIGLMTAEAFIVSYGVLGIGGGLAFVAGSLMLFDSASPDFGVDLSLVLSMAVVNGVVLALLLSLIVRAQRRRPVTGREQLLAETGQVISWAQGAGEVRVAGEVWKASAEQSFILAAGDAVRVEKVDGLTLVVRPAGK